MPESSPTVDSAFLDRLHRFLALEAPYLPGRLPEDHSPRELEELLVSRLRDRYRVDPRLDSLEPTPGLEPSVMSDRRASQLETVVRGFFRREEILASISDGERREMLRTMLLTRAVDDHLKQAFEEKAVRWGDYPSPQKGFRSTGQEAIVGAALRLRRPPDHPPGPDYDGDVIAPLIRDLGALLMFAPDPLHPILVQYGKRGTPMEGRDLHVGDLDRGVLPPAAPLTIATQNLAGIAYGFELRNEDRVCVSFIGDGGASLGEWHETINLAAVRKLNVIFVVQNNQWALGTHVREQTAVRRFADRAAGYGIPGTTLFGNDPDEIAAATAWAADRARAGEGPTLLELVTYRRSGHAHHDDDRYHGGPALPGYELEEERERWERLDPIHLYEQRLRDLHVLGDDEIREIREEVSRAVEEAAERPTPPGPLRGPPPTTIAEGFSPPAPLPGPCRRPIPTPGRWPTTRRSARP